MNFLHARKLHLLVGEGTGKLISLKYVEKSGAIIEFKSWLCTSWHSKGRTMNVRNPVNNQIRKLNVIGIIEFNGVEVIV